MTTASLPLQIIDVAERLSRSLALPEHLLRLLKMLDSQVISLSALAQALEEEPTLVARLMRIANSPFYGVAGRVDSISQALRILGTSNTQGFLTAMIAMSQLTRLPLPPAERDALQQADAQRRLVVDVMRTDHVGQYAPLADRGDARVVFASVAIEQHAAVALAQAQYAGKMVG